MVLKGANNLKMLRQLRELNPHGENHRPRRTAFGHPGALRRRARDYVTAPRLLEAADLLHVIEAAEKNLLDEKRGEQVKQLEGRNEVIP